MSLTTHLAIPLLTPLVTRKSETGSSRISSRSIPSSSITLQAVWYSAFSAGSLTCDCCQAYYSFTALSRKPGISRRSFAVYCLESISGTGLPFKEARCDTGPDDGGSIFVMWIVGGVATDIPEAFWCLSSDFCSSVYSSSRIFPGTSLCVSSI